MINDWRRKYSRARVYASHYLSWQVLVSILLGFSLVLVVSKNRHTIGQAAAMMESSNLPMAKQVSAAELLVSIGRPGAIPMLAGTKIPKLIHQVSTSVYIPRTLVLQSFD